MAPAAFLMGIGPVASWRRAELLICGRGCAGRWRSRSDSLLLPLVLGGWSPLIAFGLFLSLWIVAATTLVVQRFRHAPQGSFAAKVAGNGRVVRDGRRASRHRRVIAGVTLVNGYSVEQNLTMDNGQSVSVGGYTSRSAVSRPSADLNHRSGRCRNTRATASCSIRFGRKRESTTRAARR
jgi:cytochrome c-type biogenesis protein CcmF